MDIKRVSPDEAQRLVGEDGYVYLDVRSVPEFEAGHPVGAYNIPLLHMGAGGMEPNADFVDVVKANFAPTDKIVVGCKAGGRSLRAAQVLLSAGYTNIIDQRAGFEGARDNFGQLKEEGWRPAGLPVAIEAEAGRDYASLGKSTD